MKALFQIAFISLFTLVATQVVASEEFGYQEGAEYKKTAQPISIAPNKKAVMEIFAYHCPHCYHLEPSLNKWAKSKPKDVVLERVPAVFNSPNWIFMARVFYTAKTLGVLEKSHDAYFDALHRDEKKLFDVDSIAQFFTQFGVKPKEFKETFKSFSVEKQVRYAQEITKKSGITGVPAIVVNGQFMTDVGMAGSRDNMWKLVDYLTAQ